MRTLLLVDIQNDFLPDGALPVPDGDAVIDVANRLMPGFDLVVATQDWHPPDHESFASQHPGRAAGDVIDLHGLQQILWPDHCVQNTVGAAFACELQSEGLHEVVRKGTDRAVDSYSGFFDNGHRRATRLESLLRGHGVEHVHVMGLATDYCVRFTVLDAVELGFGVTVIEDGCRGVELREGDVAMALEAMQRAGAEIGRSDQM